MRLIDVEYDSNSEPFSVTREEEEGAVHVFEIVRHGHWILKIRQYEMDECDCPECGQNLTTAIGQRMPYCPACRYGYIARSEDAPDTDCEWICLYKGEENGID